MSAHVSLVDPEHKGDARDDRISRLLFFGQLACAAVLLAACVVGRNWTACAAAVTIGVQAISIRGLQQSSIIKSARLRHLINIVMRIEFKGIAITEGK